MITNSVSLVRLVRALRHWLTLTVVMGMLIPVGGVAAAVLLIPLSLVYGTGGLVWSFRADQLYPYLFGALLGAVIGSFRGLCEWHESDEDAAHFWLLRGINALSVGVGLPLFFILINRLPDLFPDVVGCTFEGNFNGDCSFNADSFLVAGLLFGLAFGIIVGFAEWLALRRPAIRLWMWLSVPGVVWAFWCGLLAMMSTILAT